MDKKEKFYQVIWVNRGAYHFIGEDETTLPHLYDPRRFVVRFSSLPNDGGRFVRAQTVQGRTFWSPRDDFNVELAYILPDD